MPVRQRDDGWQADITHKAQRYRAQFDTKQAAEDWEAMARANLRVGKPLPEVPSGKVSTGTLKEALEDAKKTKWREAKAQAGLVLNAQAAIDYFGANKTVGSITSSDIEDYKIFLRDEKGNSGSTINRKLAALSVLLKRGLIRGWIKTVPMIEKEKEGKPREAWFSEKQETEFIATMRKWGKTEFAELTEFLFDTGARISEALALPKTEVYLKDRKVRFVDTKNGESREVGMTDRVYRIMSRRLEEMKGTGETVIFPLSKWTYRTIFEKVRDHVGLTPAYVIHTIRHTTASRLVQRGVDLLPVSKFMGHKSIQVTMRYAKLAPKNILGLVSVLEPSKPAEPANEDARAA